MEKVVSIHQTKKKFTLEEAQDLLPVVVRITAEIQREVSFLLNKMEAVKYGSSEAAQLLEIEIQNLIDQWHKKLSSLGAHPKGLWLADFDSGNGYYCWKYPESQIRYFHGYHDGFSGRREIQPEGST